MIKLKNFFIVYLAFTFSPLWAMENGECMDIDTAPNQTENKVEKRKLTQSNVISEIPEAKKFKNSPTNIYDFFNLNKEQIETLPSELINYIFNTGGKERWYEAVTIKHMNLKDSSISAKLNPQSDMILTMAGKSAKLWDIKGNLISRFRHANYLESATFNNSGNRILTGSYDNTAKLWDLQGNQLAEFRHDQQVLCAIFNQQGTKILTISMDQIVKLWNIDGAFISEFKCDSVPKSAQFNFSGEKILISFWDKQPAKVYELDGKLIAPIGFNDDVIESIAFSYSDKILIFSKKNGQAQLWDSNSKFINIINDNMLLRSAIFNNQGDKILTLSKNYQVNFWGVDGKLISKFESDNCTFSGSEVCDFKNSRILIKLRDNKIRLYRMFEFENVDQFLLMKLIKLYLLVEKPPKNIINFKELSKNIATKFNLNKYQLREIWDSLTDEAAKRNIFRSIVNFIRKYGK